MLVAFIQRAFRTRTIMVGSMLRLSTLTRQAVRQQSTDNKLSSEEARKQAAQLAIQSIKDMGLIFGSGSDDATQPIDTEPIWKNPAEFAALSLLHQGQVLKELQDKYDKNWNKLSLADKKLGYYIAYGNWGVRDKFDNWNTTQAPYDLPFDVPSKIKDSNPSKTTIIKKLPPVILAETEVRKPQFDFKRMDPVTKVFLYLTLFITVAALFRDKKIGEDGMPHEIVIEDPYELDRQRRNQEEEELKQRLMQKMKEEEERKKQKKWYYLWLK